MNAQLDRNSTQRLTAGQALQLGRLGGELTVLEGRVWLTRDNDLGDTVWSNRWMRIVPQPSAGIRAVRPSSAPFSRSPCAAWPS